MNQKPVAKYDPIELYVLHSHIAGVLFDFMGWLTSREERLMLSSTDEAGPAVEAITAFAKMRHLRLEDAQVEHWQAILANPPAEPRQWVGLTDEDIHEAFNFVELVKQISFDRETDEWCANFAAHIEAKLKEKNT